MATQSHHSCCCSTEDQKSENTSSCCGEGSSHGDCGCGGENAKTVTQPFSFLIDGEEVQAAPGDRNIVEAADRARIAIPAPCYRNGRRGGCCNVCVVEISGEHKFACCTLPEAGMQITLNREDLNAIRKQRMLAYKAGRSSQGCGCSGGSCC